MKLYPTITTLTDNYLEKIKEIDSLNIKEACLFLTGLDKGKRKELYSILLKSKLEYIPFCHMRVDMDCEELSFLKKNFNTQIFNIHTTKEYEAIYDYGKFKKQICIENTIYPLNEKEINEWGGICLDFSHLENEKLINSGIYEQDIILLNKYLIKCNHISAIQKDKKIDFYTKEKRYDSHFYQNLSEFDYLKNYNKELFSEFCAMELENSIKEQLIAIEYINEKI